VSDRPLVLPGTRPEVPSVVGVRTRVRRRLHPVAWWIWAAGVAVAASRTRNPVVLVLLGAAVANVAIARRQPGPTGHALGVFVRLGIAVIVIRVVLTVLVGTRVPGTTLFTLPAVGLPEWAAGVSIGGPVTAEQLAGAVYAGLQLAVILCAFGAVNAVSSASRLLRSLPPVLHEAGVAVGVAVSLAPQLVVSVGRVRAARRLRGRPGGLRGVGGTVMPVLEDALDRAVRMAASMDVRGYGRTEAVPEGRRRLAGAALGVGLVGLLVGTYALLDGTAPAVLRLPALAIGSGAVVVGLAVAGRRVRRTTYRPDPWAAPEWAVTACGVVALVALVLADRGGTLAPSTQPLQWPTMTLAALVPVLAAVAPAWIAPPQPGVGT
jgi:energy-coupling factor transport system permease protein